MYQSLTNKMATNRHQEFEFPTPYLRLDESGNIQVINQEAQKLLGVALQENGKTNISAFVADNYLNKFLRTAGIVMERGRIENFVFKDRVYGASIRFDADTLFNGSGEVTGLHGTLMLLNTQETDVQQEVWPTCPLDVYPHGLILIGKDKKVKINRVLLEQTGLAEQEISFKFVPIWLEKLNLNPGESDTGIQDILLDKKGLPKVFQITKLPSKYKNSSITYLQLIPLASKNGIAPKLAPYTNELEHLINALPFGYILENSNGKVVYVSDVFLSLFFIKETKEKLCQLNFDSLLSRACPNHTNIAALIDLCDIIRSRRLPSVIESFRCRDNSLVVLQYVKAKNKGNTLNIWSFHKQDVNIKRLNINPFRRDILAGIIENSGLGCLEVAPSGKIIRASRAFRKIVGYTKNELLNFNVEGIFYNRDSKSQELIAGAFSRELKQEEVFISKKNGGVARMLWSSAPSQFQNYNGKGFLAILTNVTELQLLRKQNDKISTELEEHVRAMREYSHVIAHDFKNPLRNIHALVTWLKQDFGASFCPEITSSLNLVLDKAERIDVLLEDILKYVEIDYRRKTKTKVNLNHVVQSIVGRLAIPDHITISIPGSLPTLKINRDLMEQLFDNLLGNAISSMNKEKGKISLAYQELEACYKFSIQDNGAGIPKEYIDDIFSVFQSFSGSGTGLGLSIVKKIVEKHNGKVWLDSEMGMGSTFHFTICKSFV